MKNKFVTKITTVFSLSIVMMVTVSPVFADSGSLSDMITAKYSNVVSSSNPEASIVPFTQEELNQIKADNAEVYLSDTELYGTVEQDGVTPEVRNLWTKVAKEALKFGIKHKADVLRALKGLDASPKMIKNVSKYYDDIIDELNPLLKWSEIPSQAVHDAVYRALVHDLGSSQATSIAHLVQEVFSFLLI